MTLIRTAEGGHRDERADDRDRDREDHGRGRPQRTQEHEEHDGGQRAADVDILLHQVDGRVDVHRLVVDLVQGEPRVADWTRPQLRDRLPDALHRLDDVRADLALDAHRERRGSEIAYAGARFLVGEANVGHVPDGEPRDAAARRIAHRAQQHVAHVVDRFDRAIGADHVPAFAFLDLAGAHRRVCRAQPAENLAHGEARAGEPERIDLHPELPPAGAVDVHPTDPRHPFQAFLHHVFDELPEGVDRPLVAGSGPDGHPRDRAVLAAPGPERRLPGLRGVARYPVEAVRHEQQRLVHVHRDAELEGDSSPAVLGRALHRGEALEALERFLLAIDDLAFDLGRRPAPPVGGDVDDRPGHVRGELDGNGSKRERTEHGDHQDGRDDRPRAGNGIADEAHGGTFRSLRRCPLRPGLSLRVPARSEGGPRAPAVRPRSGPGDRSPPPFPATCTGSSVPG